MWFSLSEHLIVCLYSIVMGAFLGVVYDCVKLTRILAGIGSYSKPASVLYRIKLPLMREKRAYISRKRGGGAYLGILMFVGDMVYAIISAACYSLFLFHTIRGQVRWYFILASAIGFFIYYFTVSKFILTALEVIMFCIRAVLRYATEFVILPFRLVGKGIVKIWDTIRAKLLDPVLVSIKYKIAVRYTEKIRHRLGNEAYFD